MFEKMFDRSKPKVEKKVEGSGEISDQEMFEILRQNRNRHMEYVRNLKDQLSDTRPNSIESEELKRKLKDAEELLNQTMGHIEELKKKEKGSQGVV